jgi:hypothetical protein
MPIIARNNGKAYEPLPIGVVQAVCAFVEDIGTHETTFQGKPIQKHQVVVCWEINAQMTNGEYAGKRFMVSKFYTLSLNEKANLRKDLENWRGKAFTEEELAGFDVERLKGINCMLNIVEYKKLDGTTSQRPSAIMPCIKGLEKMIPENTTVPAWIDEMRNNSLEAHENRVNSGVDAQPTATDDGLPF